MYIFPVCLQMIGKMNIWSDWLVYQMIFVTCSSKILSWVVTLIWTLHPNIHWLMLCIISWRILILSNLDSKLPSRASYSFRVDASGASSLTGHFLISKSLYDSVNMVDIVDSGIILLDHCAVVMDLLLPVVKSGLNTVYNKPHKWHYSFRWDKADLDRYYAASFEYLRAIYVPIHILSADNSVTEITDDIQLHIDCFYRSIVNAL